MDNSIIVKIFGVDFKNLDFHILNLYNETGTMSYLKKCYDNSQEYISKYINLVMEYIYGYLLHSERFVFSFIAYDSSQLIVDLLNKVHVKKNINLTIDMIKKIMKNTIINKELMTSNAYVENIKYFKCQTNGIKEEKYGFLSFVVKTKKKYILSTFVNFYKKKVFGDILNYIYELVNMNMEHYDDEKCDKCSSLKYLLNIAVVLLKVTAETGIEKHINVYKLKINNGDSISKKVFVVSCLLFKLIRSLYKMRGTYLNIGYYFSKFTKMYLDIGLHIDTIINENVLYVIEEYNLINSLFKDKCVEFVLMNLNDKSDYNLRDVSFDIIRRCENLSLQTNILNDMLSFIGTTESIDESYISYISKNIKNIRANKKHIDENTISELFDSFGTCIGKFIENASHIKKIMAEEIQAVLGEGKPLNLVFESEQIVYKYCIYLVCLLDIFYVSDNQKVNNVLMKKLNVDDNGSMVYDEALLSLPVALTQSILFFNEAKTLYSQFVVHLSFVVIEKLRSNVTFAFLFNSAGDVLLNEIEKMNVSDDRKKMLEEMLYSDDVDDNLLDPLLLVPVRTPVMIPKIDQIFDKASILSHIHKNNNNPYTREHLTMDDVYKYNETLYVKEKINEFNIKMNKL